jgi:hypothetical protein
MNGSNDSLLLEDVNEFVMSGNTLYYATAESIFSYDIKKNQSAEICNSQASGLILDEGKIYFRNDSGIYSVVTTGDEGAQRVVKDSSVGNFVLDGKNIYYVQKLDTDDIISIAKVIDADKYTTYALLMYGSGQIECVSKFGGTPNDVDSDQLLSVALYVYPDGMYSKISFFSNALSHVEFE